MAPVVRTADLIAASKKLADDHRDVTHGVLFRIRVVSSDGRPVTVTWQIDNHPGEARPYVLNDVARNLRLEGGAAELTERLATWTKQDLVGHLQGLPHEILRPPAMRRR